MPNELELIKFPTARRFIEACLQPEGRRPSAADLLVDDFLEPNEEEDFLEVRPQLSTVKECVGGEDDDMDDSDEDVRTEFGGSRSGATSRARSMSGEEIVSALSALASPPSPSSGDERAASGDAEKKKGMAMTLVDSQTEGDAGQAQAIEGSTNGHGITGNESGQDTIKGEEPLSSMVCVDKTSGHVHSPTSTSHHMNGSAGVAMESCSSNALPTAQTDTTPRLLLSEIPPTPPGITLTDNAAGVSAIASSTAPPSTKVVPLPDHQAEANSALRTSMEGLIAATVNSGSGTGTAEFRTGSSRVLRLCSPGDETYKPHSRSASFSEFLVERGGSGGMASRGGMSMLSTASTGSPFAIVSTSPAEEGASYLLGQGGIRGSLTGSVASSPAAENYIGVVDLENRDDNKSRCLVFRLRVPFENTFKEVEFEFDLDVDDPQTVVEEMNEVEELMFVKEYADQIVQSITPVVEVARRVASENANCTSEVASTRQTPLSDLVIEKLLANHTHGQVLSDRTVAPPSSAADESSRVIQKITIEASAGQSQPQPVPTHTEMYQHGQSDASGMHTREWMERHRDGYSSAKMRSLSDSKIPWPLGKMSNTG